MQNELKPPYEYTREEFYKLLDELKPGGPCSSQKYNGKKDYKLIAHLDRVKHMSYDVPKWLYNKALNGCKDSLFKIDYGYDLYNEVIKKRKEEETNQ